MTYAKRLEKAMSDAKKSRKELAQAIGCSQQNIGMLLTSDINTERAMSAVNNVRAARFLGVSPYWLATGEDEPLPKPTDDRRTHTLSPAALELALLFDMLDQQDRVSRAEAFSKCSSCLVREINAHKKI